MKQAWALASLAIFAVAIPIEAQAPGPAKPGPEHRKLGYFAGKWTIEGEMKSGPFGPGGRMTGTDSCEWFEGGLHLVCHANTQGPAGPAKGHSVMGYDAEGKHFTFFGIDSTGWSDTAKGTLEGDTWSWNSEGTLGGKPIKARYTIKQLSPDSYSYRGEISVAGGPFAVTVEGKETRVK